MKTLLKATLTALLALFPCVGFSQALQKLPAAGEIGTGRLPNGITYYITANKASLGYADYALVQKGAPDEDGSRDALSQVGHFGDRKPYRFLSSRGVGYREPGYVSYGENHTVYRFEDVPTTDAATTDTTLMMLFDLCSLCPYEQAIVVSGDVNASVIRERMGVLSLMVSRREQLPLDDDYAWERMPAATVVAQTNNFDSVSSISISYASPRTARENLGTIHTLVSDKMFGELDLVVDLRVRAALKAAGIPVGGVEHLRKKASDGPGDESWGVKLFVGKKDVPAALKIVSGVLANIKLAGVSAGELQVAHDAFIEGVSRDAAAYSRSNEYYTDLCIASYLFGSWLYSPTAAKDFMTRKQLPSETEAEFFNQFASALLDKEQGLTLEVITPRCEAGDSTAMTQEAVFEAFKEPWEAKQELIPFAGKVSDSVKLPVPDAKSKLKLRNEAKEPVTGAKLWTFSNGMRVAFDKAPTPGRFVFNFIFRGGYSSVPGLKAGEGAYVSDILRFCDLEGLPCTDFGRLLQENGIELRRDVRISEMCIAGSAPSDKLEMVLGLVLAMSGERKFNVAEYGYFAECEALGMELGRLGEDGVKAVADSILRPDYTLTPFKRPQALQTGEASEELPARAESYFAAEFAKANDGIFALIGDLEEGKTLKLLQKYLSALKTSKAISPKPLAQYELRSGWASSRTVALHPGDESVNIVLTSALPITASRFYATGIVELQVRKALSAALADLGWWAEIGVTMEYFPRELMVMMVRLKPSDVAGLPSGITPADARTVALVARDAIDETLRGSVSAAELGVCKNLVQGQVEGQISRPEIKLAMLMTRYSYAKDLTTRYKEMIAAITPAMVEEMGKAFADGGSVEYVVE